MRPCTERRGGFILWPWLFILLMVCSLLVGLNLANQALLRSEQCRKNLRDIFTALEYYEADVGRLPSLDFYPESPLANDRGLPVALAKYGLRPEQCVCPSAHDVLRETGLTYVWNQSLNGRTRVFGQQPVWMVKEIQVMDPSIYPPHFGVYHVLYSDGEIKRFRRTSDLDLLKL